MVIKQLSDLQRIVFRQVNILLCRERRAADGEEQNGQQTDRSKQQQTVMPWPLRLLFFILVIGHHNPENHQNGDCAAVNQNLHDCDEFRFKQDIKSCQAEKGKGQGNHHMHNFVVIDHKNRAADDEDGEDGEGQRFSVREKINDRAHLLVCAPFGFGRSVEIVFFAYKRVVLIQPLHILIQIIPAVGRQFKIVRHDNRLGRANFRTQVA